jgi:hypothetical protein
MNKKKIVSDSQLKKMFKDIPVENLSSGFVEHLMSKIEQEAVRKRKINALTVFLQIITGIAGMLLLPLLTVHLCNLFIPGFSFSFSDIHINLDTNSIIIGFADLLLLIIDCICGKYMTDENRLKTE